METETSPLFTTGTQLILCDFVYIIQPTVIKYTDICNLPFLRIRKFKH